MKKRVVALIFVLALATTMLTGCVVSIGGASDSSAGGGGAADTSGTASSLTLAALKQAAKDTGFTVIVVYILEFASDTDALADKESQLVSALFK